MASTTDNSSPMPRFPHSEGSNLTVSADTSVQDALGKLEKSGKGLLVVTDDTGHFLGSLSDFAIRQGIVDGHNLTESVRLWLNRQPQSTATLSAKVSSDNQTLLKLMDSHNIEHLPLLDDGRCCTVVSRHDLTAERIPIQGVIMAGGFGTRLRPLTIDLPKPMLPVGGRPLLELIVRHLAGTGIDKVHVSTFYKAEKIIEHFGQGERFGVELTYLFEDQPLGTAGAVGLVPSSDDKLLVMNGDILTSVNVRSLLAYHRRHGAALTVGVRTHQYKIPYGVINNDGARVRRITEKPTMSYFVNAGIYLLEPVAREHIPEGRRFDMTDLMDSLLQADLTVACFPILEYWLDIGQHADYQQAQEDVKTGRFAA